MTCFIEPMRNKRALLISPDVILSRLVNSCHCVSSVEIFGFRSISAIIGSAEVSFMLAVTDY